MSLQQGCRSFPKAVGMAELPDLQWSGAGDASLSQDLPFTGMASADQIEVALSPLWRLSTRLLGDASTRAAGLQLRQRFSFFSTCPGAVETLLSLIPVLGEQEDQELLEGPMDAVDPGANQLGAILEYLPVVRPTQDVGVLTTGLVAHHSEQQARALTGLFLHTTGITSVDVRTMIGNENLGLMPRAFWRGRELLIQQLGAWMFRCINSFQTLRALDGQWSEILGSTELPTTLDAPNTPEGERGFLLAELLQISQERQRRMASVQRLPIQIPDEAAQVVPTAGTGDNVGQGHVGNRQGRAATKATAEYRTAARGSGKGQSVNIIEQTSARCRTSRTTCSGAGSLEACKPCTSTGARSTDSPLDSIAGFNANGTGAVRTGGCIPVWDSASPDSSSSTLLQQPSLYSRASKQAKLS